MSSLQTPYASVKGYTHTHMHTHTHVHTYTDNTHTKYPVTKMPYSLFSVHNIWTWEMCKFSVDGCAKGEGSASISCCPKLTFTLVLVASTNYPVTMLRLVHTHTHTQAHTCAYSAGKCSKASTSMHRRRALSPIHEICQFQLPIYYKDFFILGLLS